jgi:Protein of unknown function (DUF2442)/Domain of unknown function (DUF4160)
VYFYSHEPNEPAHVHVDRDDQSAKFWLKPSRWHETWASAPSSLGAFGQSSSKTKPYCWRNGMRDSEPKPGERVKDVRLTESTLEVDLLDGRTITVPSAWYPRLFEATPEERRNWQVSGAGYGIHWPDLDEDLSTEGLLRGAPAAREPAHTGI